MKKINYLLIVMFAAVFIYSCGKKGDTGPAGPRGAAGATGATGATGSVGATGANGTKIYSGIDTPTVAIGDTGDFYIDLTTSGFYGPKSAAGWGTPFSLVGATGAAGSNGATGATGTPGSVIYSGTTVPDSTIGINGDYYLNTITELFYGPKTNNQWPAPISIMGQPGTANVIYSDWLTTSDYSVSKIFGRTTFKASFAEPKITQAILDEGAVMVYGKLDGYNAAIWPVTQVSQLPIVLSYVQQNNNGKNQGEIDTWSGVDTLGSVGITFTNNHNLYTNADSIYKNMQFRYIIIPGGVSNTANAVIRGKMVNRVIAPAINAQALKGKSYDELKQILHLKD